MAEPTWIYLNAAEKVRLVALLNPLQRNAD